MESASDTLTRRAGAWTVGETLSAQARRVPHRVAIDDGRNQLTYAAAKLGADKC